MKQTEHSFILAIIFRKGLAKGYIAHIEDIIRKTNE